MAVVAILLAAVALPCVLSAFEPVLIPRGSSRTSALNQWVGASTLSLGAVKTDDNAGIMAANTNVLLDTIVFAAPTPSHNLEATNASAEVHPQATADCRTGLAINRTSGGQVLFDMGVSPTEVTHLTVKYWGSVSVVNGTPFVKQGNTWLLDPTCRTSPTSHKCVTPRWKQFGWAHSWPCELDQADPGRSSAIDGPFPGRWQYTTYPLPQAWTANKTIVRLGLGTGLFQW
jgi:hypothetical protein